ncbi:phosphonate ABC transporter, permease protein PhnE [Pontibacillus yanchengensis]|uniref:Alkylphosphonate ABC transporter permease n=1 Tax=Pontibacillus yanchengensis Y32 TaxID=1385514 RepID=A0A0A2TFS6_9BACI|nr:phosphonate ABC transporter, permease protein PhnE [Pontibacillus yanchengensis]KGP74384.1 alkylphosphonate ABC transporter permease [Pontibacillus yanchengensis Y32]
MNSETNTLPPRPKQSKTSLLKKYGLGLGFLALIIWSIMGTNEKVDWTRVFSMRTIENMDRVIPKLFQPTLDKLDRVLELMLETLLIAFTGSFMASILAIPLGFLTAKNMMGNSLAGRIANFICKLFLNAVRTFPEILLALIFVASIGPSPFAGVLAIAIGSTGMLGKLYGEVIETIDMQVVEAMEANGANKIQTLFYGIIPQILPDFLSYAIYRFEIDVRASTILGIIGAGGIGTLIVISQKNRNWDEVSLILIVIIISVTIIDLISAQIRKRLV